MSLKGIDVSSHNGIINWSKVKNTDIKFAIIRAGYGDGNIDKETISRAFIGYAPKDNPKFTITILSPNVKYSETSDYSSPVNFKISKRVANKVFEFFK